MSEISIRLLSHVRIRPRVFEMSAASNGLRDDEVLYPVAVAMARAAEAAAFALRAEVVRLPGLCRALVICCLTSVCGGRPGVMLGVDAPTGGDGATGAPGATSAVLAFCLRRFYEHPALRAIHQLGERVERPGKGMDLWHLAHDGLRMSDKAGGLVEAEICEDAHHHKLTERSR